MTDPKAPTPKETTPPSSATVVLRNEPENVVVAWVKKVLEINYMSYGTKKSF
jgi:hypothetical protein